MTHRENVLSDELMKQMLFSINKSIFRMKIDVLKYSMLSKWIFA